MRHKHRIFNCISIISIISMLAVSGCGSAEYVNGSGAPANGQPQASQDGSIPGQKDSGKKDKTDKKKKKDDAGSGKSGSDSGSSDGADASSAAEAPVPSGPGTRDNTPVCLVPEQPGTETYGNDLVTIDTSNSSEGYISVSYSGTSPKVKLQLTCPNTVTYTYNLSDVDGYEVFPLTVDSGTYSIGIFENITGTEYSTCFRTEFDVSISNEFGPYLYPNQYVNFNADDDCVAKAAELAYPANSDLDVVTYIYNYMINNVVYDTELANTVQSGYLPDPDRTLNTGQGICLDYSCLMASMLRSQNIPTHMEVGYASTAYHAWISIYLKETGWVNGIIEFNGTSWELMDPTFAASSSASELQEFIGDGSNYETKYIY